MMRAKLIMVALAVTVLSSGCMCLNGSCRRHGGSPGSDDGGSIAKGDLVHIEDSANRAEAAANRAEATADVASMSAEKSEALFHKGLRK